MRCVDVDDAPELRRVCKWSEGYVRDTSLRLSYGSADVGVRVACGEPGRLRMGTVFQFRPHTVGDSLDESGVRVVMDCGDVLW